MANGQLGERLGRRVATTEKPIIETEGVSPTSELAGQESSAVRHPYHAYPSRAYNNQLDIVIRKRRQRSENL